MLKKRTFLPLFISLVLLNSFHVVHAVPDTLLRVLNRISPCQDGEPLFSAIEAKDIAEVRRLLKLGMRPSLTNANGSTALHVAVAYGLAEIATLLMAAGNQALVNIQNKEGYTPLHFAIVADHPLLAQRLLAVGARPNIANNYQVTPLHLAAYTNHTELVSMLLKNGADPNIKNRYGNTSLHEVLKNPTDATETNIINLLDSGANPMIMNNEQKTPLSLVMNSSFLPRYESIKKLLHNAARAKGYDL